MRRSLPVATFVAGVITGGALSALAGAESDTVYQKLEILAQVLGNIENHYVDSTSATSIVYGAAKGAVSVLDEHSAFFSPDEYKELLDATEGEYAGIGVELDWEKELPSIATVLEGSPAYQAGLKPGDRLLAVDGKPTAELSLEGVHQLLRGPVGTRVVLTLRRANRDEDGSVTLVRGWVRIAPIEHKALADGIGYVHIKTFSRRVATDLAAVLARDPPARGLVLDLRGNPGGLFDEAVAVVDQFLTEGPIVTAVGRGGRIIERHEAHAQGAKARYPVAVLIDGGSASAAEVVAGSLHDRGRARLFGSRSYGKGSVQSVLDLSDGSGLKLTIARYYTPSGRQIDGNGIEPDEAVAAAENEDAPLAAARRWLATAAPAPRDATP